MSELSTARTVTATERTPATIAAEINIIKEQVRQTAVHAAIQIGKRLNEAKSLVPFGAWREWLEKNVDYSERTAQNMMALADEYGNKETQAIADLPVTKAVMLLGVPSEDREAFMQEHPVEDMTTRELKQAIEELKAENDRKQLTIDELMSAKNAEMMNARPDGLQAPEDDEEVDELRRQLDEMTSEKEIARERADRFAQRMIDMEQEVKNRQADIESLRESWKKEKEKVAGFKDKQAAQQAELATALQNRREAEATIQGLRAELAKASEPVIRKEDTPETLARLKRMEMEKDAADAISRYRAGFEMMKSGVDMMIQNLEKMDEQVRVDYVDVAVRAMGIAVNKIESEAAKRG